MSTTSPKLNLAEHSGADEIEPPGMVVAAFAFRAICARPVDGRVSAKTMADIRRMGDETPPPEGRPLYYVDDDPRAVLERWGRPVGVDFSNAPAEVVDEFANRFVHYVGRDILFRMGMTTSFEEWVDDGEGDDEMLDRAAFHAACDVAHRVRGH